MGVGPVTKAGRHPAQRVGDSTEQGKLHLGVHQEGISLYLLTCGLPWQGLRCRQGLHPLCLVVIQECLLTWVHQITMA